RSSGCLSTGPRQYSSSRKGQERCWKPGSELINAPLADLFTLVLWALGPGAPAVCPYQDIARQLRRSFYVYVCVYVCMPICVYVCVCFVSGMRPRFNTKKRLDLKRVDCYLF
ncbi:unnamed protein product, partial [Discosporangium mesarthrocarpum]